MLNRAEIDLNKLIRNAKKIKEKLGGAKFNAVVKADAYGHGAAEVANALYPYADSFSVALPEEGVMLRQSGIDKEILVLTEAFPCDLPMCARYNLTITVSKPETVYFAEQLKTRVNAHVKINTGMNRQGADYKEIDEIFAAFGKCPNVFPAGMYSHLRAPENKTALKTQLDKFLLAYNAVKGYNKNITAHVSASGGFLKGAYFDMCRIGLLLYGYKPFYSNEIEVEPVMRVIAPAVGVRFLKKGDGLLYGTGVLEKDETVSLIRYGYADGLPRGKSDLLPANRCMDVSAYRGEKTEVAVLNGNADEIAEKYGTIPYEILCHAARRAERIYIR